MIRGIWIQQVKAIIYFKLGDADADYQVQYCLPRNLGISYCASYNVYPPKLSRTTATDAAAPSGVTRALSCGTGGPVMARLNKIRDETPLSIPDGPSHPASVRARTP